MLVTAANYERSIANLVDKFLARPKMLLNEVHAHDIVGQKKLARSSRLAYHSHGRILKDRMGDVLASAITPAMVEDAYAEFINKTSITSANAIIMRSWKTIFIYGEDKLRWA